MSVNFYETTQRDIPADKSSSSYIGSCTVHFKEALISEMNSFTIVEMEEARKINKTTTDCISLNKIL
jgi:hypothetical protein